MKFVGRAFARIQKMLAAQVDYEQVNQRIQENRLKYEMYRNHF